MPYFLIQSAYKDSAIKTMIGNPQGRESAAREAAESLGGKVHGFYFAFGEYDVVSIVEFPGNEAAAGYALSLAAGGSLSRNKTTVLLTPSEAVGAMTKAKAAKYSAPR